MPKPVLEVDKTTSARMGRIRQAGTAAELAVRRVARTLGLHYRTLNPDLPGRPDLANRARGWAVFVHGCFWHRHNGCIRTTTPTRNRAFWLAKFQANMMRDARAIRALQARGFAVVVIWECEAEDPATTARKLKPLTVRSAPPGRREAR